MKRPHSWETTRRDLAGYTLEQRCARCGLSREREQYPGAQDRIRSRWRVVLPSGQRWARALHVRRLNSCAKVMK